MNIARSEGKVKPAVHQFHFCVIPAKAGTQEFETLPPNHINESLFLSQTLLVFLALFA